MFYPLPLSSLISLTNSVKDGSIPAILFSEGVVKFPLTGPRDLHLHREGG